ncbi:MAG: sugar-binding domain-containing protein [Acidaminococcaceae bacterium]|nr:sugar-binding domain-containing protein [Acidaminococcaceae bacterium]
MLCFEVGGTQKVPGWTKEVAMDNIINLQRKIVPELSELLVERYKILRQVSHDAPIGRRALSSELGLSERVLRSQVDFLKNAGLLHFSSLGMSVTEEGADLLKDLSDYVRKLQDLSSLEKILMDKLHIGRVVIIPGDCDEEEVVKQEIGRAAAKILLALIDDDKRHIVAVSGGTTLAALAENVRGNVPNTVVVPARGGLGDKVEYQANTIATALAGKLKAKYRQLYIPDSVSGEVLASILREDAGVKSVVEVIKNADIFVHGMGQANVMAQRRGLKKEIADKLTAGGAVGEAIGQYCDIKGNVVHVTNNAGLVMQDLARINTIMGIAGGKSKAKAMVAILRASKREDIVVTDEAAARAMAEILMH